MGSQSRGVDPDRIQPRMEAVLEISSLQEDQDSCARSRSDVATVMPNCFFCFAVVVIVARFDVSSSSSECFDDEVSKCQARMDECETDPTWMLRHCRATCDVCVMQNQTIEYNPGLGKIPDDISTEVLLTIRTINRYALEVRSDTRYALTNVHCKDRNELCAFWTFQGQCSSTEYIDFMKRECPLSCQLCGSDEWKGVFFLQFLLGDLSQAYSGGDNATHSRRRSLTLLLETLRLDPGHVGKSPSSNWVLTLHDRLMNLIPSVLLKVYASTTDPAHMDDLRLLGKILGSSSIMEEAPHQAFVAYRSRGFIVREMQEIDHLITRSIELSVGFAVPNEAALATIQEVSPVIQIGAGAGYWAALLRYHGVDIVAYDLHPPDSSENAFFDYTYVADIQQGSCIDVFRDEPQLAQHRSLLLVWPNDPDPVDNQQFCDNRGCEGSQATWDTDCLTAFLQAGGSKVVFVGEREQKVQGEDCGLSATRQFQHLLHQRFRLISTVSIPNWWLNQDDLSVWELKVTTDEL